VSINVLDLGINLYKILTPFLRRYKAGSTHNCLL